MFHVYDFELFSIRMCLDLKLQSILSFIDQFGAGISVNKFLKFLTLNPMQRFMKFGQ